MGVLLRALLLTVVLLGFAASAQATPCKCRQHKSEAEAIGTCSRTEDANYCTLKFSSTTEKEYIEFVDRLRRIGVIPPREALTFAFRNPPQAWKQSDLASYLPALFAVSQRTVFQDQTAAVAKAIAEVIKSEQFVSAFMSDSKGATKLRVSDFEATVSFGCIELRRNKFYSMVKTRWSEAAQYYCDDF